MGEARLGWEERKWKKRNILYTLVYALAEKATEADSPSSDRHGMIEISCKVSFFFAFFCFLSISYMVQSGSEIALFSRH